jgi:hypothetical protein
VLVLSAVASGYSNLLATSFYPAAQNQLLAQTFNVQQKQAPSPQVAIDGEEESAELSDTRPTMPEAHPTLPSYSASALQLSHLFTQL